MTFQDAIILTFIIYFGIKWALKADTKDPDFNLDDPETMSPQQRADEVGRLISRADSLCAFDKIPGRYIRISQEKYARLVRQYRNQKVDTDE